MSEPDHHNISHMTDIDNPEITISSNDTIRMVFFADTHLGFDDPASPRIDRRRRGPDFMQSFLDVLEFTRQSRPHFLVHGGDLFYRSKIPAGLVDEAFSHLRSIADLGIHVLITPGNHERGSIPRGLLAIHPGIFIFDRHRTFRFDIAGHRIAFGGFPCVRDTIRAEFRARYCETELGTTSADFRFLCIHQAVDYAVVGPQKFRFFNRADVIDVRDIPVGIDAVLSGHIHPHQVLNPGNRYPGLRTVVIYPGSTERTSFAEEYEAKGYVRIWLQKETESNRSRIEWMFQPLNVRPMRTIRIECQNKTVDAIKDEIVNRLESEAGDSVIRLRLEFLSESMQSKFSSLWIRSLGFDAMNIELASQPLASHSSHQ